MTKNVAAELNGGDGEENEWVRLLPMEQLEYPSTTYRVFTQRWWVLGSFGVLSMSSAWIWITWSPIARECAIMWDVSIAAVDALAAIYLYVYMFSFVSLYLVVNHLGLQKGLLVGAVFNAAGATIRYYCMDNYNMVYFGTFLAAVAQTFTLSTPPLIAGNWFSEKERASATALGVLANQLGAAIGLGATILVDFTGGEQEESLNVTTLQSYLGVQLAVTVVALVLVAVCGGDQPPTPPNLAAALLRRSSSLPDAAHKNGDNSGSNAYGSTTTAASTSSSFDDSNNDEKDDTEWNGVHSMGYVDSIRHVLKDMHLLAFVVSFGMPVGIYYTIPAFLSQLLPTNWSSRTVGIVGISYQMFGIVGSFGSGVIVDWTQRHQPVCLALVSGAIVSLSLCAASTAGHGPILNLYDISWLTTPTILVGITGSGLFLAAWNTIGLEFGTALTYPADEAAVGGLLECTAELSGFLWVSIGGHMIDAGHPSLFCAILALITLLSLIILRANRSQSKRPAAETGQPVLRVTTLGHSCILVAASNMFSIQPHVWHGTLPRHLEESHLDVSAATWVLIQFHNHGCDSDPSQ